MREEFKDAYLGSSCIVTDDGISRVWKDQYGNKQSLYITWQEIEKVSLVIGKTIVVTPYGKEKEAFGMQSRNMILAGNQSAKKCFDDLLGFMKKKAAEATPKSTARLQKTHLMQEHEALKDKQAVKKAYNPEKAWMKIIVVFLIVLVLGFIAMCIFDDGGVPENMSYDYYSDGAYRDSVHDVAKKTGASIEEADELMQSFK